VFFLAYLMHFPAFPYTADREKLISGALYVEILTFCSKKL